MTRPPRGSGALNAPAVPGIAPGPGCRRTRPHASRRRRGWASVLLVAPSWSAGFRRSGRRLGPAEASTLASARVPGPRGGSPLQVRTLRPGTARNRAAARRGGEPPEGNDQSAEEAARAPEPVRGWVTEDGLALHPTKTKVIDARADGFDFLGYHFRGPRRRPRPKGLAKLKATIRAKPRRTRVESMATVIAARHRAPRGWFAYFQQSRPRGLPTAGRLDWRPAAEHPEGARPAPRRRRPCTPAVAECRLRRAGAVQSGEGPCVGASDLLEVRPSTGEPCAGDRHARFGGRGGPSRWALPTPIHDGPPGGLVAAVDGSG